MRFRQYAIGPIHYHRILALLPMHCCSRHFLKLYFKIWGRLYDHRGNRSVVILLVKHSWAGIHLNHLVFICVLLGWWCLHLMVSLSRGESSGLRVSLSTSLRSLFPPLTLTKKGHRLPADGETQVAPHYFCLMHKFMLLLLWTEKV
jgi:hypothetical protein